MVEKPEEHPWSSYLATAGRAKPHPCLTTDWVLGQFSIKRAKAEKEYRQFISWGIGKPTIWTEVRGQSLLGEEDFVDKLSDHLRRHKDVPEIPRSQRYASRPSLEKIFTAKTSGSIMRRNKTIVKAVEEYGYRQREIADHLGMYFTSISRIVNEKKEMA
jgi:hypothetical protein